MFRIFRKYSVSVLNRDWKTIQPVIKVKHIPRAGELIYLKDGNYYSIINVVHNIEKKQGIFLIVELVGQNPQEADK